MTTAVSDMQTAYTDAAGRTLPDATELGAGNIGGMTLAPGLYKWSTGVTIPTDVTLSGGASDVWIFQIAQTLGISSGKKVLLSGGAQAGNIFWQVAGQVTLATTSVFNGNILGQTAIVLNNGATLNGRALAQTAVTLDANPVTKPPAVAVGTTVEVVVPPLVGPGQTAVLNVIVKNVTDLGVYDLKVAFNKTVIQVQQVLGGTAPFDGPPTALIDNNAGTVTFLGSQGSIPGPTGGVVVAKLQVLAVGASGSSTLLNMTVNGLFDATNANAIVAADVDNTLNVADVVVAAIQSGQAVANGTILLDVTIKNITDIDGLGDYSLKVSFNAGAIQVLDVQGGVAPFDAVPSFNIVNGPGTGSVSFASLQSSQPVGPLGSIVVARIQVKALAGATALDMQVSDPPANLLGIHDTNGDPFVVADEDGTFKTLTPAQVTVASVNGGPGDIAYVPITVSQLGDFPAGLKSYDLTVAFNKNVLTVLDVLGGDAPFDVAPTKTINNIAGTVQLSSSQTGIPITADTVVARLKVTAALTGTSALTPTVTSLKDLQAATIPSVAVNGTFTVVVGVQIESGTALVGAPITLKVTVRNVTDIKGLGSYSLRLEYPVGTLTVNDVLGGDAPFNDAPAIGVGSGFVKFAGLQATPAPGPTGNVVVARIVITPLSGPGALALHMVVTGGLPALGVQNTDGVDLVVVGQDGVLTTFTNTPPLAVNDSYQLFTNSVLNVAAPGVLANDTDAELNALTAIKVTNPSHGAVTLNANGSFAYTPTLNYNGPDSFTYKANDTKADSNVATVSITVSALAPTPTAVPTATATATPTPTNTPVPPPPTATPVVTVIPPTAITPIPTFTPAPGVTPVPLASAVIQPNAATSVTAAPGAGSQTTVNFPAQSFLETKQVTVRDVPVSQIPNLPAEIQKVTKAFEINVYSANGVREENPSLNRCITISAPYTSDDVAAAGGNPFSLKLMRYDSQTKAWIVLSTSVDVVKQTLNAQVCSTLSVFGVGVFKDLTAATPGPVATPTRLPFKPYVGGAAPGSNLLLGLLVAGIILVISGGYYLRRARG